MQSMPLTASWNCPLESINAVGSDLSVANRLMFECACLANGGEQLAADKKRKLEESLSNSHVESDSIGKLDTDTVENGTKKPKTL